MNSAYWIVVGKLDPTNDVVRQKTWLGGDIGVTSSEKKGEWSFERKYDVERVVRAKSLEETVLKDATLEVVEENGNINRVTKEIQAELNILAPSERLVCEIVDGYKVRRIWRTKCPLDKLRSPLTDDECESKQRILLTVGNNVRKPRVLDRRECVGSKFCLGESMSLKLGAMCEKYHILVVLTVITGLSAVFETSAAYLPSVRENIGGLSVLTVPTLILGTVVLFSITLFFSNLYILRRIIVRFEFWYVALLSMFGGLAWFLLRPNWGGISGLLPFTGCGLFIASVDVYRTDMIPRKYIAILVGMIWCNIGVCLVNGYFLRQGLEGIANNVSLFLWKLEGKISEINAFSIYMGMLFTLLLWSSLYFYYLYFYPRLLVVYKFYPKFTASNKQSLPKYYRDICAMQRYNRKKNHFELGHLESLIFINDQDVMDEYIASSREAISPVLLIVEDRFKFDYLVDKKEQVGVKVLGKSRFKRLRKFLQRSRAPRAIVIMNLFLCGVSTTYLFFPSFREIASDTNAEVLLYISAAHMFMTSILTLLHMNTELIKAVLSEFEGLFLAFTQIGGYLSLCILTNRISSAALFASYGIYGAINGGFIDATKCESRMKNSFLRTTIFLNMLLTGAGLLCLVTIPDYMEKPLKVDVLFEFDIFDNGEIKMNVNVFTMAVTKHFTFLIFITRYCIAQHRCPGQLLTISAYFNGYELDQDGKVRSATLAKVHPEKLATSK